MVSESGVGSEAEKHLKDKTSSQASRGGCLVVTDVFQTLPWWDANEVSNYSKPQSSCTLSKLLQVSTDLKLVSSTDLSHKRSPRQAMLGIHGHRPLCKRADVVYRLLCVAQVAPGLWVGALPAEQSPIEEFHKRKITHVLRCGLLYIPARRAWETENAKLQSDCVGC